MCAPWDEAVVLQLPDGFGCGPVSAGVLGGVLIFIEQSIASITRGADSGAQVELLREPYHRAQRVPPNDHTEHAAFEFWRAGVAMEHFASQTLLKAVDLRARRSKAG